MAVLILCFSSVVTAHDFGVIGPLYLIKEEDVLTWIECKLKELEASGETQKIEKMLKERVENYVKRPTPVSGISKTLNPRRYTYDPSVKAPFDLKDRNGKIFHQQGDKVNPLDNFELDKPLIFIDGDDAEQLDWALNFEKNQKKESTLILVKGPVFELMKNLKRPLYFDQGGSIVKKLNIQQVPACVVQEGNLLIVEEIKIN